MEDSPTVQTRTRQIYDYVTAGEPSKGLRIAWQAEMKKKYMDDFIFLLNCAHAAMRSRSLAAQTSQRYGRYLRMARKLPNYHQSIESGCWYSWAEQARQKDRLDIALKMYKLGKKLDQIESKDHTALVEDRISAIAAQIKAKKSRKP
jgi:hypothetical protein